LRNLLIVIGIIVVLASGYFIFLGNKNSSSSNPSSSSKSDSNTSDTTSQNASNCSGAPEAANTATITYTSSGFTPDLVSLKAGGKLTIKNSSGKDLMFSSDPHPVHTDNKELNVGQVSDGSEQTVTLNTTGCFGYHNHFSSSDGGKILVK
jgi:hypothetical protein